MDVTKSSVSLSWSRPRDDGGSRVTGYYIDRKETTTEKWVRHNKTHITTTMYTITGLVPDAEYQFRIIAQNDIGLSEPSPASDSVICKDPFGKWMKYLIKYFSLNQYKYCVDNKMIIPCILQTNQANQVTLKLHLYLKIV